MLDVQKRISRSLAKEWLEIKGVNVVKQARKQYIKLSLKHFPSQGESPKRFLQVTTSTALILLLVVRGLTELRCDFQFASAFKRFSDACREANTSDSEEDVGECSMGEAYEIFNVCMEVISWTNRIFPVPPNPFLPFKPVLISRISPVIAKPKSELSPCVP